MEIHLCETCKFINKCDRLKNALKEMEDIEFKYFKEFKLNLNIEFYIDECDIYRPLGYMTYIFMEGDECDNERF